MKKIPVGESLEEEIEESLECKSTGLKFLHVINLNEKEHR